MNDEGKNIKEIKREDYIKLIDLVGRKRADEIFESDGNLDDDTKYPIREIRTTIFFSSLRKYIIAKPGKTLLIVIIGILISIIVYGNISFYW